MKNIDVIYAKGNFFEDIMRFFRKRRSIRSQKTFCWCPVCKEDLCSNNSFVDEIWRRDVKYGPVRYICTNCDTASEWNFDVPTPFLIKYYKRDFTDVCE